VQKFSALYAEFIGTFAMVFCGTAAMAVNETTGAVAHEGVAITWGLIVMVMIYAFGEQSGAHFNPAVTVSFALANRFAWKKVPRYVFTQTLGAIAASMAVKALLPESEVIGATIPSISHMSAFWLELLLSFFLMLVILHISTGSKEIGPVAGVAVGSVILLEAMFAGPLTNASMNPVRSLGPALIGNHWEPIWIYLTAPFIGMALAVGIFKVFVPSQDGH
jgi:aquaporin Z|tara:strand:- start:1693 stop:2352 length:660 start_codon:yes stop_codon:yes gene_type:complete